MLKNTEFMNKIENDIFYFFQSYDPLDDIKELKVGSDIRLLTIDRDIIFGGIFHHCTSKSICYKKKSSTYYISIEKIHTIFVKKEMQTETICMDKYNVLLKKHNNLVNKYNKLLSMKK